MNSPLILKVAINVPLSSEFDYLPADSDSIALPGSRVLAPFGRRREVGAVATHGGTATAGVAVAGRPMPGRPVRGEAPARAARGVTANLEVPEALGWTECCALRVSESRGPRPVRANVRSHSQGSNRCCDAT